MYGDDFMLSLVVWREARGEGDEGMTAVACVVRNRVNANKSSYYREITKPWQFSSISASSDPQLNRWPSPANASDMTTWQKAQEIAAGVMSGVTQDVTNGATYYYAVSIPMPLWASSMTMTCQIGNQRFYKQ
jgi:cell wall hydrolase